MDSSSESKMPPPELTAAQKARIEKNRLKALMLRDAKLIPHPSAKIETDSVEKSIVKVQGSKYVDSGGGFLVEESSTSASQAGGTQPPRLTHRPPPILDPSQRPTCRECCQSFSSSYLLETFDYKACDKCRDDEDKHSLITRTEAKNDYLLKDCDFDGRKPVLRCILRSNPHNSRWGSMKLYLHIQVEERALLVWGSAEALQAEKEQRAEKKDVSKSKKYSKEMKALRMNVRSSLYVKTKANHVHLYGAETYCEERDIYSHTCTICQYVEEFEKM